MLLIPVMAGLHGWLWWPLPAQAQTASGREDAVKAAYIYNFAKFTEWPAAAGAAASLVACALGEDPLAHALSALTGKRIGERRLEVRQVRDPESAEGCHILYLARPEAEHLAEVLAALDHRPVLTVGDTPGFAERGGMIGLVVLDRRVRFHINAAAVEGAGLNISSKLLKLAVTVHRAEARR